MAWITAHLADIIVCLILGGVVFLSVFSLVRKRKRGQSPCGCDCGCGCGCGEACRACRGERQ